MFAKNIVKRLKTNYQGKDRHFTVKNHFPVELHGIKAQANPCKVDGFTESTQKFKTRKNR
jgi:hypothetical protein